MGKLIYALMIIVAMEFALIVFAGQEIPGTSLYDMVTNPFDWDANNIWSAFNEVLLIAGALGIVAGLYFIRNEWIVYAGLSAVFISFGLVIAQFYQFMESQGIWGDAGPVVVAMLIAPVLIAFIITVLDFSRGKD